MRYKIYIQKLTTFLFASNYKNILGKQIQWNCFLTLNLRSDNLFEGYNLGMHNACFLAFPKIVDRHDRLPWTEKEQSPHGHLSS